MSTPIAMPDLGNDVYLRFTSGEILKLQFEIRRLERQTAFLDAAKQLLDGYNAVFIHSTLKYGLKNSKGNYIFDHYNFLNPSNLIVDDPPVPLNALTARIFQALQQVVTG
ncbi:hypothetical protein B2G69_17030 [Methylorubrum zatmanii]|nr:hypothetical protein [Methylorubrum zatmanii]ARO55661.1 hypothetical protein B2G69_17030 [Methylorubrum zatmanii]